MDISVVLLGDLVADVKKFRAAGRSKANTLQTMKRTGLKLDEGWQD